MNIRDFFFRKEKGDLPTWKWNHIRALRIAVAAVTGTFVIVGGILFFLFTARDDRPLQVIGTPAHFRQDGTVTYTAIFLRREIPPGRYAEADSIAAAAIRERYFRDRPDTPKIRRVSEYRPRTIGKSIQNTYADYEEGQRETERP